MKIIETGVIDGPPKGKKKMKPEVVVKLPQMSVRWVVRINFPQHWYIPPCEANIGFKTKKLAKDFAHDVSTALGGLEVRCES